MSQRTLFFISTAVVKREEAVKGKLMTFVSEDFSELFSTTESLQNQINVITTTGVFNPLTQNHILVGSAANVATDVAMSGDVGIIASGLTTIQNLAVTTAKINTNAVTYAKMQQVTAARLLGNPTGVLANVSEISLGGGLTFVGTVLTGSGGTVTSVGATAPITSTGGATPNISTSMNTTRLIGRTTAGVGVMEEITLGTNLSFAGSVLNATTGGMTNPMTTLGDLIYENAVPTPARLAGNTTIVKQFLSQTGTGVISAAPAWAALAATDIPLTAGQIGFGSGTNSLTGSVSLTWNDATQDFSAAGTIGITLLNSGNAAYIAQGDAGYWFTGTASTGLLGHRGFGIDLKTTQKYTMGDAASGSGNSNYIEINDSTSAIKITTLAGAGGTVVASAAGVLSTIATTTGTVTSVATAGLISGGTITTTGTITTSMNTNKLVGRGTAGVGVMEEITLGTGLSLTATTLNVGIAAISPLTTKGDVFTFSTVNARLAIGVRNGNVLQVDNTAATGNAWSSSTYPSVAGSAGKIIRSDGTDNQYTTSTFADTYAINTLLYNASANTVSGLATANSGILVTSAGGVPSIASDIPTAVTIGAAYIYRVAGTDVAVTDGGTGASTAAAARTNLATYFPVTLNSDTLNPVDATTYYFGAIFTLPPITTGGQNSVLIPFAGVLKYIEASIHTNGTLGSSESIQLYVRNNTSATDITISLTATADAKQTFASSGLITTAVAAGDKLQGKIICPTWVTNPTQVRFRIDMYFE